MHVSHGTRTCTKKMNLGHITFLLDASFWMKPDIGCSRTAFGLCEAFPSPFFSSPFFTVGGASEQNLSCPFAGVETQELVVVFADAGRNSWFVARMKMKTLGVVCPQATHYASDVRV